MSETKQGPELSALKAQLGEKGYAQLEQAARDVSAFCLDLGLSPRATEVFSLTVLGLELEEQGINTQTWGLDS